MIYKKECVCLLCEKAVTMEAPYPLGERNNPGGWVVIRTYMLDNSDSHLVCTDCSKNEATTRQAAAKKHYKSFYQRIFG